MPYLIVQQRVQDYEKWKPVFDEHRATRISYGATCEQLLRSVDDPNEITVLIEVPDLNKAREFTQSEDLKNTMQRAGVVGTPKFSYLEEVETHELAKSSI